MAPGLHGERRAVIAGIVLGEDEGLSDESARELPRFGALPPARGLRSERGADRGRRDPARLADRTVAASSARSWRSRRSAGTCSQSAGSRPSSGPESQGRSPRWPGLPRGRAIAGTSCSLGAALLLAWSPYSLLDAGFQLSFAAVGAIFVVVPRLQRRLAGYPVPHSLARGGRGLRRVRARNGADPAHAVRSRSALLDSGERARRSGRRPAPRDRARHGDRGSGRAAAGCRCSPGSTAGWPRTSRCCARMVGGLPYAAVSARAAVAIAAVVLCAAYLVTRLGRPSAAGVRDDRSCSRLSSRAAGVSTDRPALPPPTGLRITFLDVGQGDGALIQVPGGAVLVDEGPPEAEIGGPAAAPRCDEPVADRPHASAARPRRRRREGPRTKLRVGAVLDPAIPSESPDERSARAAAQRNAASAMIVARAGRGVQDRRAAAPRPLAGRARHAGRRPEQPRRSCSLASYGQTDALLTADAESDVTGRLHLPPVEILKVAHHGSADDGLARRVRRSCGRGSPSSRSARGNDYGHPTPSTSRRSAPSRASRVYRTDENGRVVVESDGAAHHGADEPLTMLGRDVRRAAAAGLSPHGQRPAEASARAPPASFALRSRGRRAALGGVGERSRRGGGLQRARAVRRARRRPARRRRRRRALAEGRRRGGRRRTSADPVEGAVLALVAEEPLRGTTLAELCEKHGQVLATTCRSRTICTAGRAASSSASASRPTPTPRERSSRSSATTRSRSRARSRSSPRGPAESRSAARGRAARRARRESGRLGADRCLGRARPADPARGLRARARERREPFLLAVRLASHVGRVRAAQALAEEGLGARDVAARLKMKEFPARKALQHAERYSRAELDSALVRLAELDAAIKGGSRLSAELELLRALIDVTRPAEQPVACGLALRDEPRGLGLLPRRGVPVERAVGRRPVDPALKRRVLGGDLLLVAGRDRSLEPTGHRLDRRAEAEVVDRDRPRRSGRAFSVA